MVDKINIKKILVFLLLALAVNSGWNPRAADIEFPLVQSMSYFPYADNTILEKSRYRLSLDMYYSNVYMFDYERTTVSDMETLSSTLALRYGFSDRITFELYYRFVFAFGGLMDGLIIDFHNLFGLPGGGREEYPRHTVNYRYKDAFAHSGSPIGQSPLVLGILTHLYSKGNFRLNGRLALGLPLSSKPGFSSSKPFFTAGIILLYKKKNISIDFSNHLSLFGNPNWLGNEDLKNRVFLSQIRVDYKKIFGGLLYRSSPFRMNELANGAYQLYIGYKISKYFELSFIEEFPPLDTAPDVSFRLRVDLNGFLKKMKKLF